MKEVVEDSEDEELEKIQDQWIEENSKIKELEP